MRVFLLDTMAFISVRGKWVMAVLLLLLALLPLSGDRFFIYLITQTMILCIFALACDIVFGYTGILSLGHSVFFGVPPYIIGVIACTKLNIKDPFVLVGAAVAAGLILGAVMGFFATFTRGIYLALVTFSFAQIFTLLILSDPGGFTLGENGIVGLRPHTFTLGRGEVDLFRGTGLYYLVLFFFIVS
jgi:branched-chain amino acid transport system permease protein